jgi:Ca2+-binding RTX toxin-like protein
MEANALAGDDVIELPAGDYTLTIGGVGEDLAASGDLDVREVGGTLTIRGAGADVTTIDAASLERVFHVFAGATLNVEGVTITGGLVTGSEDGGGVRNDGGTVTITDSVITGNVSQDDAGGINNTGNLTLTRVTVSDNSAARTGGGVRNSGQLTIIESTIGGEHDPADPTAPDLRNTSVLGGGGIINLTGGTLTASNSTISGNVSTTSQGAGLFTIGRGTLTNVTISNNEAAAEGGGIAVSGGLIELRNTLVAGNVSTTAIVDINDTTGGASLGSTGNNLIGDNTGATVEFPFVVPAVNGDLVGTAAAPIDPLLSPLFDNGGPTLTHNPLFGSAAIDAGGLTSSVRDQRGIARDLNGVDIGAVEFGGFFVNSTADSIDIAPGDGIAADSFGRRTLRAAIMEANALPGTNAIQLGDGIHELSLTEIDTTAPTADIVDVTPDPLNAQSTLLDPIDEITVNFSEPVQGVDLAVAATNFTLTFDDGTGPVGVPLTNVTVRQDSDTQYVLEGLTALLVQDGLYDLRLNTAGITDFALAPNALADDVAAPAANVGAFDTFVRGADIFAPTAMLSQVTTPRTTNPGAVTLTFSEPVFGVDLSSNPANFALTYDDDGAGPNVPQIVALNAVSVQQITSSEYVLDLTTVLDFTGLTDPGDYSLTFDGTATTIFDFSVNPFAGAAIPTAWTVQADTTPPSADIVDVSPDPRIGAVGVTTIDFTEDVTGVDLANAETDFDLFRDIDGFGTGAAVTQIDISGLMVTQVTDSQYTVDLTTVTAGDGEYRFVVRTDGAVLDLAGSPLAETLGAGDVAEDFWTAGDTFATVSADDAASFGDLDITAGDLVIIGNSAATSVIDANQIDRVFDVFNGTSLSLQNVTVTGGQTVGGNDGGGVRSLGTLAVTDSTLTGNSTDAKGGAIYAASAGASNTLSVNITATDAALSLVNVAGFPVQPGFVLLVGNEQMRVEAIDATTFSVTRAVNGSTATVHSAGATISVVDMSLTNVTINANSADFGAAAFNDGGTVAVTGSSIVSNAAVTDGGGIYNDRTATLNVVGSTLVSNAAGRDGGGVYNNDSATASITDATLNANTAVRNGGGLFNEIVATANLGNTRFSANTAADGGGIYNEDGQVVITGGSLIANVSSDSGGGLHATSSAVTTIDGTSVSGNRAGGDGGAFINEGTLNISNATVASNTSDGDGAAIANSSFLTINTAVFSANAAVGSGGAIYNDSVGNLTLAATTISNNSAGVDGGGIANTAAGRLTFGTSTLDANTAGARGGGLFHSSAVTASITESTISNNSAANGGGIGAVGSVQMTNSTVSGNSATANGGGINNGADSTYLNVTIVNNSATANGGGIFNTSIFSPARLKNTIVARNSGATGADIDGIGFVSQGNNLIGDGGAVPVFVDGFAGNLVGATGTEIDPLISPLQDSGGATLTHALLFGSPARDAGNNVGVTANDQRGFDRRFDGDGDGTSTVDIGAFESGLTVNSFLDTVDVDPGDRSSADLDGNSTLRAAIMEANAQPGADSIVLLPGTYRLTIAGQDENDTRSGDLDVTEALTIIGAGDGSTIIDAAGLDRAFHVIAGASLNLMGVTVINGDADLGGAILNQGVLNIENSTITNSSARLGGGIYNDITEGELDGAILAGDPTIAVSDVTEFPRQAGFTIIVDAEEMRVDSISGSTFTVTRGVNGTIANAHLDNATVTYVGTATVTLLNANVVNNEALLNGGGIYNNDQLVVTTSSVSSNMAGVRGGGVYNTETVTIDQSTLDSNVAEVNGGAIYNEGTVTGTFSSVTITGSTLSNNEAGALGGAIFNSDRLTIDNSTLSGNSTGSEGGAIYNTGVTQQVTSTVSQASVTVVLDFIEANQLPFVDVLGAAQGVFNVMQFGFQASEFDTVTQAILDTVNQQYFTIPTSNVDGRSPIPQAMQLDIEFVIGDVGTAPSNGATEFYYVTIGSDIAGTGPLGVAFGSSIRDAAGNPSGGFNSGDPVGTVYSDNIQGIGQLTPSNALMSGDLFFTANAIAGTTSHEIGHALSLFHVNATGFTTPTGAFPILGTGALALPNQQRILPREFSYSGFDGENGNAPRTNVQQLVDALGLRDAPVTSQSPGVGFLSISNSTIVNNTSDLEGGGIVNASGSTAQLRNSIVAANIARNANLTALNADNDVRGAFTSQNTNFIGDSGTSSGFINGFRGDQVGSELSPLDPVFGVLATNGGATQTHELLAGSPAIDAGDNSGGEPIDQRNGQRPTDNSADIGAFEVQQNTLRITDVTAVEGNSGSTEFIFSVLLDTATAEPITVSFGTIQGTATQGSDFLGTAGTLVFAPGELSKTITVEVNGDTTTEASEQFIVQLFSPLNAVLSDAQGVGTILNDDAIVTFADVDIVEGDSGTATATFNVVLSNGTSQEIQLGYQTQTAGGTAMAMAGLPAVGGDYDEASGTLTFAPGETSQSFPVTIHGDTLIEDFETFVANLTLVAGSVQLPDPQAVGTIQNDDVALADISNESVDEDEPTGSATFTVGLTQLNAYDVTVNIQTVNGVVAPAAVGGSDFDALPPTTSVTIPAGTLSVTQDVTIINDTEFEGGSTGTPETFTLEYVSGTITQLVMGSPVPVAETAGITLGAAGTGSITDNELPPTVWVIRVDSGTPSMGEVLRDGTDNGVFDPVVFVPLTPFNLVDPLVVNGDAGTQNDRFIVDFVNGNPIPVGGLTINGGDETSGDSLEIVDFISEDAFEAAPGTLFNFDSVVYTSTGVDSGTIVIEDGAMVPLVPLERTITYAELEPILDTVAAVDREFTIDSMENPGDHVIDVANAGGRTIISDDGTSAFESVEFANPTSTLTLNAGNGNNTITVGALDAGFAASFTIDAEDGDDNLTATATNIALSILGGDGLDTLVGGGQNDTIDGEAGDDSIEGGAGVDSLAGGANNDTVKGGAGTDSIDGGTGNDSIEGGTEGDTLLGNTGDDSILGEDGDDSIDGGTGTDTLDGGIGNDTITGGDGGDSIDGGAGMDSLDGGGDADTVSGGADNDTVLGGSGTDVVAGGAGDDLVDGGSDNDTLSGGGGADTLIGGDGNGDQVAEVAVDAETIVLTNDVLTVGGLEDSVSGVEEFILTGGSLSSLIDASGYTMGNVTIDGAGGDDTLIGSNGDDFINGGAGNDTLTGSLGNDSMLGGAGSDLVDGGSANDTLVGNSGNDTLNGGTGLDSIDGGSGGDFIDGGDDNDTALGGAGSDSINGGLGNDRLLGEAQDDTINGDDGDDTMIGGAGGDSIRGGAGIDNLNGQSGRDDLDGGADDDTVFGGAGQDTLTGGQGIDNLDGQGSSFDVIRLVGEATDDVFTLDRSANFNQLRKTSGTTYGVNFKRTETIEINTLDGNDTITVIGALDVSSGDAAFVVNFGNGNNLLDASLNTDDAGKTFIAIAGTGNDTLKGGAGADNLNAGSGDDSIDGGAGEDTLTGGAGADILNGDAGADLINGGTENDTISGGLDADTINGEDGNDLLYGDAGNDSILGGRDDDSIDGGDNDDTIIGERGFDVIKGGGGNDSLVGGDHDDTIDGGNGNDLVNGNLGADVLLGGNGNDLVNGNDGEDVLLGGADDDTLLGGSKKDILLGGTGADDIRGQGSDGDTLVGETGDGTEDLGDIFVEADDDKIFKDFVLDTAFFDKLDSF